jgi:hypothetical protein
MTLVGQRIAFVPARCGVRRPSLRGFSNDGVVEYSSSHLDGVDSEYIVRSAHSTQSNPRCAQD